MTGEIQRSPEEHRRRAEEHNDFAQQVYQAVTERDSWTAFDVTTHLAIAQLHATLYVGEQLKRLLQFSRKT